MKLIASQFKGNMKIIKAKLKMPKPDPFPTVTKRPKVKLKPWQTVTRSGIYRSSLSQQNATMVVGEPAPPTFKKGETWGLIVDPHPHK